MIESTLLASPKWRPGLEQEYAGLADTLEQLMPCLEVPLHLPWIDAILYGPYIHSNPPALERFCASGNQGLWLLSDRFQAEDFSDLPVLEFLIGEKGELIQSGLYGINFIEK